MKLRHMKREPRMSVSQPGHYHRQQSRDDWLGSADAQFADGRVGDEIKFTESLTQVVKNRRTTPEQSAAINIRLDTLRGSVEQPVAERSLHFCNRFRYRGLRH